PDLVILGDISIYSKACTLISASWSEYKNLFFKFGRERSMAGVLDNVNQRTRMVGQNRLEMLLFSLGAGQLYGINVFKVKEVLQCPKLTEVPKRDPVV